MKIFPPGRSKRIRGIHTTHSCFPVLLFDLPLFLLLYIVPTTLATDAAADAAEVAAPQLLLLLLPLLCTPHEMRVEGDGVRWWGDVGMVVVVIGLGICKCQWVEGLGACQHSQVSRHTLLPLLWMQLLLCTQLHSLGLSGLAPIICVGTCYPCSLAFAVHVLWPLVESCTYLCI